MSESKSCHKTLHFLKRLLSQDLIWYLTGAVTLGRQAPHFPFQQHQRCGENLAVFRRINVVCQEVSDSFGVFYYLLNKFSKDVMQTSGVEKSIILFN